MLLYARKAVVKMLEVWRCEAMARKNGVNSQGSRAKRWEVLRSSSLESLDLAMPEATALGFFSSCAQMLESA